MKADDIVRDEPREEEIDATSKSESAGPGRKRTCARATLPVALAILAAVAVIAPAAAQFNPFASRSSESGGLNRDDIERLNRATERLYSGRSIGTVERWRNPDTGTSGSVKLLRAFTSRGMECRRMRYKVKFRDSQREPAPYIANWCRTASGEWKLLEPAPPD